MPHFKGNILGLLVISLILTVPVEAIKLKDLGKKIEKETRRVTDQTAREAERIAAQVKAEADRAKEKLDDAAAGDST